MSSTTICRTNSYVSHPAVPDYKMTNSAPHPPTDRLTPNYILTYSRLQIDWISGQQLQND